MANPCKTRVVVVGAGPSGLTTLKTLLDDPDAFDPLLLEAEGAIGGTFRYRSYENAELVSSKQLTGFSDFRCRHPGDHLSLPEYVAYLEAYADRFGLADPERTGFAWTGRGRMQMGCRVVRIERGRGGKGHCVRYRRSRPPDAAGCRGGSWGGSAAPTGTGADAESELLELHCDALAICTGLHVVPAVPTIPGFDRIPERMHSSEYRGRHQLRDKRVCILGCGETAMDVGYEAVQAGAKEVFMCQRGGFLSFPKVLNDFRIFGYTFKGALPIDGLITNLFETAYVHPWIAASRIRWFVSDFVVKRVLWFLTGTSAGCNQWVGELPPERLGRAYVFLNKASKAMPYINRPYRPRFRLMSLFASYEEPALGSPLAIEMAPFPTAADGSGRLRFPPSGRKDYLRIKDREVRPDLVVYCTGYRQDWSCLGPGYAGPGGADARGVVCSRDPTVAYVGFVRPGVGAIPPLAELQAMWWLRLLKGAMPLPSSPGHYRLLASASARIQYGVDHSAYAAQLARDMGAAPGLWDLYRTHGLHVLACYCFGAAFVTLYRLTGPYRSPLAPGIARTELWATVARRGALGNLAMAAAPMLLYGSASLCALLAAAAWAVLARPPLRAAGCLDRVERWVARRWVAEAALRGPPPPPPAAATGYAKARRTQPMM